LLDDRRDIRAVIPLKRLQSLEFFMDNTDADYYLWINDDSFIMVRNIGYLISFLKSKGKDRNAVFMLGNCMFVGEWFLQGAHLFLSRAAAKLYRDYSAANRYVAEIAEDVAVSRVINSIGINVTDCASGFFLGQYLDPSDVDKMEEFRFDLLANCPNPDSLRWRSGCKTFLSRYNKLVGLHRLTNTHFHGPVIPVWNYPDNIYWYMGGGHYPRFCLYNGSEHFVPDYD
jgi:hypothetical protein